MDEAKRAAYAEIGSNYRFFAGWRQLTFAGGVVLLGAVLQATLERGIYKTESRIACLAGGICELILILLDQRTREHTKAAVEAGVDYEAADSGFFSKLAAKTSWPSHTFGARSFFTASALVLFSIAFRWIG